MGLSLSACAFTPAGGNGGDGNKGEDDGNKKPPVPIVPIEPEEIPSDPVKPGEVAVTFDTAGGAFASGQKTIVRKPNGDGKVEFDELAWRDGYAFTGWYNGTVKYDPTATYESAQTFTAHYEYGGEDVVYTALFNESSTVAISINMSDAEWKKLDNDYREGWKSPIYRQADNVVIGIDGGKGMLNYYYEDVGVRMKGNTSRHKFYGDEGFYNPIHMKLSFKETFDDLEDGYTENELTDWTDKKTERDFRKARTLGGMTKIDIKYNSTLDETYIRELYAMKLFRENGIYAPNITLGSVSALNKNTDMINLGVYRIHEPVDEEFVLRHIEEGDKAGDLYKCTWGNRGGNGADLTNDNLEGRVGVNDELNNEIYAYEKKTNKKKDKTTGQRDFSSIINFIRSIEQVDAAHMAEYIDVDLFAKFEAINYILGNPDCIRNHANNYYLYFRKSDNKAIIIPFDYDRCLGSKQWDNYNAMTDIQPFTRQTTLDGGLRNPLYTKLIVKGAPCDEGSVLMKYRSNLLEMAQSNMLKPETFNALKDKYKARYGGYTKTDIKAGDGNFANNQGFDENYLNMSYADYINAKLEVLRNNIDNYRS